MNNLKKHPKNYNEWLLPARSKSWRNGIMKQLSPTKTETLKEKSHVWRCNVRLTLFSVWFVLMKKMNFKQEKWFLETRSM